MVSGTLPFQHPCSVWLLFIVHPQDDALMRPGRLDRLLYVEPPDFEGRKAILRINLSKMQVDPQTNVDELAELVSLPSAAGCGEQC